MLNLVCQRVSKTITYAMFRNLGVLINLEREVWGDLCAHTMAMTEMGLSLPNTMQEVSISILTSMETGEF